MKINFKFVGVNVEFNVERFTIGIGSFFLVFAIVEFLSARGFFLKKALKPLT